MFSKSIKNLFNMRAISTMGIFAFGVFMLAIGTSLPADALSLSEFKGVAGDRMQIFKDLVQMFCLLAGTVLVAIGLGLLWKNYKEPGRDHAKHGMIALLIAGCFFSIPAIVDLSADVATGTSNGSNSLTKKTL